ncbi:MAG: acetyl-CoA C-acetyltransferase [candidate division NC10 bacterium]|nr:acetyl-CoA C-acetyltransferase [candidate division NC10 bacterium]
MEQAVVVSAVRTPVGKFGGSLKDIPATKLGALVINEAIKRANLKPAHVEWVIMGSALQATLGLGPARKAMLEAGLSHEVSSYTVNKASVTGIETVGLAAQAIWAGTADVVVAGGMENMSRTPFMLTQARWGHRMGSLEALDHMIHDGLTCPGTGERMGVLADSMAEKFQISREDQDRQALTSQQRAAEAIKAGKFKEEIIPVSIPQAKGDPVLFPQDEHPRPDATLEALAKLQPAFSKGGTVTAGNSSGITDGAAAVVVMSMRKAKELDLKPWYLIRSWAHGNVEPAIMAISPVPATRKAVQKAGLKIEDIDLFEVNEAFAVKVIGFEREVKIDNAKINVHGGSIAIGHPIGACGTRIFVTLLYALQDRGLRYGVASMGAGGGEGNALVVERLT